MKCSTFLLMLCITLMVACSSSYKNPGPLEFRGYRIGGKVDTTLFVKYKTAYFPNYLDGWTMNNVGRLPEKYEGLPIAIWLLKADSSVALTLLEDHVMKITVSKMDAGEMKETAKAMTASFGAGPEISSYEETHPLQDWVTYWNLKTWETDDVIVQIGNGNMRKPHHPAPAKLMWELVYTDLGMERDLVEEYKKGK